MNKFVNAVKGKFNEGQLEWRILSDKRRKGVLIVGTSGALAAGAFLLSWLTPLTP